MKLLYVLIVCVLVKAKTESDCDSDTEVCPSSTDPSVDTPLKTTSDIEELMKKYSNGSEFSSIDFRMDEEGRVKVYADHPLKLGDVYMKIHGQHYLSSTRLPKALEPIASMIYEKEELKKLRTPQFLLSLLVMYLKVNVTEPPVRKDLDEEVIDLDEKDSDEEEKDVESALIEKYQAYLKFLPEQCGSLQYFSKKELKELQDDELNQYVTQFEQMLETQYKHFFGRIDDVKFGWNVTSLFPSYHYTYDLFKWANICVASRKFLTNNGQSLVPIADLFDHEDAELCHGEGVRSFVYDMENDTMTFFATRAFEEGEELKVCYNAYSNRDLMKYYSFALENNRYNSVVIKNVPMHPPYPLPKWEDHTPSSILQRMCVKPGLACARDGYKVVSDILQSYPTTIEEDDELLEKLSENKKTISQNLNTRFAIVFRKSEKKMFKVLVDLLKPYDLESEKSETSDSESETFSEKSETSDSESETFSEAYDSD